MKYLVPKGRTLRVTCPDEWKDFSSEDNFPITAHFEGGGLVVTRNQDKELLGSWGPRQFLRAELVPA